MARDILFLLPPGFVSAGRREYCPECAEVWGLLHYFPAILASVDIRYQPIDRPRPEMTAMLGDGRQNCPTLALDPSSPAEEPFIQAANGVRFVDSARDIGRYYAARFGTPHPRGT